jgi:hypothetical protein
MNHTTRSRTRPPLLRINPLPLQTGQTRQSRLSRGLPCLAFAVVLHTYAARGQSDTWDVGLTEALIARNKQEHAERRTLSDGQLRTSALTEAWRSRQNEFRRLSSEVDRRLTSVFIVLADGFLAYEAIDACREMLDLQQQSLQLLARHPQALVAVFGQQERIVRDAGDLLRFGHMVVAGHGELGRMKTASRQAVYRELRDKLQALRLRCRLLHDTLRRFDLAASLRNQPALAFLARDRAIVDDIIRRFR